MRGTHEHCTRHSAQPPTSHAFQQREGHPYPHTFTRAGGAGRYYRRNHRYAAPKSKPVAR